MDAIDQINARARENHKRIMIDLQQHNESQAALCSQLLENEKWLLDEKFPVDEGQPLFSDTKVGFAMLNNRITFLVMESEGERWATIVDKEL